MTTQVDANPQVTSLQNTDTQNVQSCQDTSCNNSSCACASSSSSSCACASSSSSSCGCGSSSSSSSSSTGLAAMMEYTLSSLSVNNDAAAAIGEAGTLIETVSTKNAMDQLDDAESSVKGMEGMINNWSTISGDLAAYSADRVAHDNAYSAAKNNVASASKALASAEKLLSAYRADSAGGAIDAWIQGYTVSADAAALSKAKAAQGIESGMAATFSTAGAQALSSIYNALGIKSGGMSIDQLKSLQNLGYTKVESQLQYQNQYCQQLSTYATSQKDEAEKYQSADESYSSACQQLVSNESGLLSLLTNLVSS